MSGLDTPPSQNMKVSYLFKDIQHILKSLEKALLLVEIFIVLSSYI
jgi:hypothetical protein